MAYPLETVSRRLQVGAVDGAAQTFAGLAREIVTCEGPTALYRCATSTAAVLLHLLDFTLFWMLLRQLVCKVSCMDEYQSGGLTIILQRFFPGKASCICTRLIAGWLLAQGRGCVVHASNSHGHGVLWDV